MTLNTTILEQITKEQMSERPDFAVGDTICVSIKVTEGKKTRLQRFEGLVIARKSRGIGSSFIVLKQSGSIKVERTFPLHSRLIEDIEVKRRGLVRQAKIYYMRDRTGKSARIKERLIPSKKKQASKN